MRVALNRAATLAPAATRSCAERVGGADIIAPMPAPDATAGEQLMRAYAAGDAGAFEVLYDRHATRLGRFVLRCCGDAAAADELTQEVWLAVAQQAPRYAPRASAPDRPPARFTCWLFTIAHHRVVDHLRATRSRGAHASLDAETAPLIDTLAAPSGSVPVRRIETRQQAAQLMAAIAALPPEQREAFLLQAEAGLAVHDIASSTGVPFETAKSRLRHARAALRRRLEGIA